MAGRKTFDMSIPHNFKTAEDINNFLRQELKQIPKTLAQRIDEVRKDYDCTVQTDENCVLFVHKVDRRIFVRLYAQSKSSSQIAFRIEAGGSVHFDDYEAFKQVAREKIAEYQEEARQYGGC